MDTLLNLSGGVDSVYCMWQYLTNNPDKKLLVHHVARKKSLLSKREYVAVKSVLKYFTAKGMTNYEYIETAGYSTPKTIRPVKAIEMVGWFTGIILRSRPEITKVIISANAEDLVQGSGYNKRSQSRFDIIKLIAPKEPEYLYPIKDMTKAKLAETLPNEILSLCWYCRKPTIDGKTCGVCQPCRLIRL